MMTELREMREEMRREREDFRNELRLWREKEMEWEREREKERLRMERLEEMVVGIEEKNKRMERNIEEFGRKGGLEKIDNKNEDRRLRMVEINLDKRERELKRENIVIKGIRVQGVEIEKEIEELWETMEIRAEVKEVRKIGRVDKEGRGMVLVKMRGREEKRKVFEGKRKLKGRLERIEDDMTLEERKVKWKLENVAAEERRKGRRVRLGYMRMWIEEKLLRWDEIEEKLIEVGGKEIRGTNGKISGDF